MTKHFLSFFFFLSQKQNLFSKPENILSSVFKGEEEAISFKVEKIFPRFTSFPPATSEELQALGWLWSPASNFINPPMPVIFVTSLNVVFNLWNIFLLRLIRGNSRMIFAMSWQLTSWDNNFVFLSFFSLLLFKLKKWYSNKGRKIKIYLTPAMSGIELSCFIHTTAFSSLRIWGRLSHFKRRQKFQYLVLLSVKLSSTSTRISLNWWH